MLPQSSIGNAVNLGISFYRQNLKLYLKLSAIAHLFLLVPIYGWAKFLEISALISRLAFAQLTEPPEKLNGIYLQVEREKCKLLGVAILQAVLTLLAALSAILALFLTAILLAIIASLIGLPAQGVNNELLGEWIGLQIAMLIFLFVPLVMIWVYSRFFVTEILLLMERPLTVTAAMKRSWNLTKGMDKYIQGVIAIAFLTNIPAVWINGWLLGKLLSYLFANLPAADYNRYSNGIAIFYLLGISWLSGVITMPLWQAIEAILYNDLRNLKEGRDILEMSHSWSDRFPIDIGNR